MSNYRGKPISKTKVSGRRVLDTASSPAVTAILGQDIRVVGEKRYTFDEYGLAVGKWAGGKRDTMPEIVPRLPGAFTAEKRDKPLAVFDMMFGAGGFSLNIPACEKLVINDINLAMMNLCRVLRDQTDAFISKFRALQEGYQATTDGMGLNWYAPMKEYYLAVREYQTVRADVFGKHTDFDVKSGSDKAIQDAAVFKFLILNGFNGLWRVNQKGECNTPIGQEQSKAKPKLLDIDREIAMLRAVAAKLQGVVITNYEFDAPELLQMIDDAKAAGYKVVCYFDPPYIPVKEDSFTAYAKERFNMDRQRDLRRYLEVVDRRGISWLLSQSDCDESRNLFGDGAWKSLDEGYVGFAHKLPSKRIRVGLTSSRRQVNSNGNGRGAVNELLITNYGK